MDEDTNKIRFLILLSIFSFSILRLIFSRNLILLLVGWDLLGLSSYILVCYYNNTVSGNSGIVTYITNRLGDVALILGCCLVIDKGIRNVSELLPFTVSIVGLVLFASIVKRAQLPFRAWLPAAIAAPTPVSSLVHSSTLVTAGVYLIFRLKGSITKIHIDHLMIIFGTITIIIARIAAFSETDMKKIVALSTLRQLGVIITAIGVGFKILAFFHLIAHAFFKALLFIRAGKLIHASERYQDMRFMGGSSSEIIPLTTSVVLSASMSLCGLPLMSAFYSKEMVIELMLIKLVPLYSYLLMMLGIAMTLFYRIRFLIYAATLYERQQSTFSKNDTGLRYNSRIVFLFVPAVTGGSILNDSLGPNIMILIDTKVKIFTLTVILLTIAAFKIRIYSYQKKSVLLLWLSGSL